MVIPCSCRLVIFDHNLIIFAGISTLVITFDVGAVLLDDSVTQAPAYCFNQEMKNM
jgi:hypothetical protein